MFISVARNGKLTLHEPDDFKRLHVEASDGDLSRETINAALAPIAASRRRQLLGRRRGLEIARAAIRPGSAALTR